MHDGHDNGPEEIADHSLRVGGHSLRVVPAGTQLCLISRSTKTLDTSRPIHVAISGAAGRVGYALLFRIANGGLFGKEQPIALSLLDLPDRLDLLEARRWNCGTVLFPCCMACGSAPTRCRCSAKWTGSSCWEASVLAQARNPASTCCIRTHRS